MSKTKRKQKKHEPEEVVKITPRALNAIINREAKKRALEIYDTSVRNIETDVFKKLMVLPTIVIMDSFSKIMPKEGRIKTFMDLIYEQYQYIESGEINIDDLCKEIEEELGEEIRFENLGEEQ